MSRRRTTFAPPIQGECWPQECRSCGMCGHNATSHDYFMQLFPEVKREWKKSWSSGWAGIHHKCLWCRDYRCFFKREVPLRIRLHRERHAAESRAAALLERSAQPCPETPPWAPLPIPEALLTPQERQAQQETASDA